MPVVLKRWSVPTGEPDNTERVPSGSVGGWGKRSVSHLARSLPNLRSRFRQQVSAGVRLPEADITNEQCVGEAGMLQASHPYNAVKGQLLIDDALRVHDLLRST